MKLRILGCGTSSGVPRIGNDWGSVDPMEPRNRRRRASILVSAGDTRILVDTTPDMREQLLDAGVSTLTAVIWTHDHADHVHGLDDLRQLFHNQGEPVSAYADARTLATLKRRFDYVFEGRGGYPATVSPHVLDGPVTIGPITIRSIAQPHGGITSLGLRFDCEGRSVGYSTDFNDMADDMASLYEGLDLWVVDALRARPHPTHSHLDQTLGFIERVRPGRALLTHMDNSMDYRRLMRDLPNGIEPAFDGMEVDL